MLKWRPSAIKFFLLITKVCGGFNSIHIGRSDISVKYDGWFCRLNDQDPPHVYSLSSQPLIANVTHWCMLICHFQSNTIGGYVAKCKYFHLYPLHTPLGQDKEARKQRGDKTMKCCLWIFTKKSLKSLSTLTPRVWHLTAQKEHYGKMTWKCVTLKCVTWHLTLYYQQINGTNWWVRGGFQQTPSKLFR